MADPRKQLRKLLSAACDGELGEASCLEIERLLTEHPELAADYAEYVATESLIEHSCGLSVYDADGRETVGSPRDHLADTASVASTPTRRPLARTERSRMNPLWAVAALALFTTAGAIAWWSRPAVATVVAANDARLSDGAELSLGQGLGVDWVDLKRGSIRLALRDGAMASIEAPARFRVRADNAAELGSGAIRMHVPESAHGFRLVSEAATIVDLGTGFRAVADGAGRLSAHVTEGSVRVEPTLGESVALTAGQIASTTDGGGFRVAGRARTAPRTNGQLEFLAEHPKSLGYDAFVHDGFAYAFLESHAVRLPYDLRLDIAETGRHRKLSGGARSLPAGTVVDCYLLHCAPKSPRHEVNGSIRFGGEVLGVLCRDDRLNATNELLGAGWTLLCQHPERGAESAPDPNSDEITISADRRRLSASFRTMSIDQVRVLVASE